MSCLELSLTFIYFFCVDILQPRPIFDIRYVSGCCVKGSVVVVSITIQLLLLVYWMCLNKNEWISQHDNDDVIIFKNIVMIIAVNPTVFKVLMFICC